MKLREALILQPPSLELQRSAASEIARLDDQIDGLNLALKAVVPGTHPWNATPTYWIDFLKQMAARGEKLPS